MSEQGRSSDSGLEERLQRVALRLVVRHPIPIQRTVLGLCGLFEKSTLAFAFDSEAAAIGQLMSMNESDLPYATSSSSSPSSSTATDTLPLLRFLPGISKYGDTVSKD